MPSAPENAPATASPPSGAAPGSMYGDGFDAVIIGAGHNGMALAAYLLRSGFSVAVFERRCEEGGGLCTEELTEPGFLHNLHSNYHSLVGLSPVYDDLGLFDEGVEYALPDVQMGSVFADGSAITIHTDMRATHESFARFSRKDADTWLRLWEDVRGYLDLLVQTMMYAPPISVDDITRALVAWGVEERSEFLSVRLRKMSVADFLDRHFENDRIKAMLAFHAAVCAYQPHVRGLAVSYPILLGKIANWQICRGGSHRLAHALLRAIVRRGGRVFPQVPVEEIVVEDGRAVGVRVPDGFVRARRLVASSVDVNQTFEALMRPEHVPAATRAAVREVRYQDASLFNVHLALEAPPRYRAASFDPAIDRAWIVNVGYESLADFAADFAAIREGRLPEPVRLNAACNSLYDPLDAPPGKATGLLRVFAPFGLGAPAAGSSDAERAASAERWDAEKDAYAERCVARWRQACSSLEVRRVASESPLDLSRRMVNYRFGDWMVGRIHPDSLLDRRPTDDLSQYRTPIAGLYLCGASQHPHGYITFAPGYNCLEVVADDLGLEKWWRRI